MLNLLLLINGFFLALICLVLGAAAYSLKKLAQGRAMLSAIQEVHNSLTESVAKIDSKAQEALLRLDHIDALKQPRGF